MLRNGTPAPGWALTDADDTEQTLDGVRQGKPLLLYFFRGEFCPTSQRDLKNWADVSSRLQGIGVGLAAISTDTPAHHRTLRETLGLPFPLLSDPDFATSTAYGVYQSDDTEGTQPHGEPALFVLDVDGKVAYSQIQTGPKGAASPAEMVLVALYMSQNGGRY